MIRCTCLFLIIILSAPSKPGLLMPVQTNNRQDVFTLQLTKIGAFGLLRKARPTVKAHLHTGIDVKRPSDNYLNEPIFPIADGIVVSKRDDGPYAQLIVAHEDCEPPFWTVYEHIAGIKVNVGDLVDSQKPIARFMNKNELDRYGWQFDHFHLEVLKEAPLPLKPNSKNPQRFFSSYTLQCFTEKDLRKYFYDPIKFLQNP